MAERKKSPMVYIIENLFTNKKADWITKLEDTYVEPYVIQRWLAMIDGVRVQVRWLDKYVFVLPPKMYLSLAWTVLPKTQRMPYINYIKKGSEEDEEFDFILKKIRKQFQLADNDYFTLKDRILEMMKKNMVEWFSYYGIPKKYWKKYYLNFELIKKFGNDREGGQTGLSKWGI